MTGRKVSPRYRGTIRQQGKLNVKEKMKDGMFLAKFYGLDVRSAFCHDEGNWFWNLTEFPGAYFDADGCVIFETEKDYLHCVWLSIYARNTGVRGKHVGMSIKDIDGYKTLNPRPISV